MDTQNNSNSKETEMFSLSAENFDNDKFYVVSFQGYEALNELFNFSIDFVCKNKSLDTDTLMSSLTTFSIARQSGEVSNFSGYPINVEQSGQFGDFAYYHVDLRPTFWKMTQLSASRIFLNKTIKDIIKEILEDEQFLHLSNDFNFVKTDYPQQEFVMQYNETNFDFISWILEQNGAYFYFDQDNKNNKYMTDKLVFCDQPSSHNAISNDNNSEVTYAEISGLDFVHRQEIIYSFRLKQSPLPRNIVVRDYDWKKPNQVIAGKADVSQNGLGTIYLTNENVESESEANRIAKIRAEELQCHSKTYYGKSVIPTLRPGFTFKLKNHYNQKFNQEYLLTKVTHEGSQESFLTLGLGIPMLAGINKNSNEQNHYYYRNDFECIEAKQVYHPKRKAPRAEIKGVIRGFIDGAGDSSRPEVDEYGRYKVIFPFDTSGRDKGKGSCWIRRSQEQVGQGSGLNFPLLGGVEVTISFLNGNPNLPIISGALANGETQSLSKNTNTNSEGIHTAGGNRLVFGNTDKKQGFALQSAAGRGLVVGAGSLSSTQSNTDYGLNIANSISTSVNGMASGKLSGMKTFKTVYSPASFKHFKESAVGWILAIIPTLLSTAQGITKNIADKTGNEDYEFTSNTLKALQVALMVLFEKLLTPKSDYSATLQTEKSYSFSKLESLPYEKADAIAWSVISLVTTLFDTTKSAVEDSNGITKDKYESAKENYNTAKEAYEKNPTNDNYIALNKAEKDFQAAKTAYDSIASGKKATGFKIANSVISELLPELIALSFLIASKGGLNKRRLGGVLLNSTDANITLAARDPIALHTARGVLLNTEDLSIKDKKLNNEPDDSGQTFAGYEKGSHLKWGVADKDGKLPNDYTEGAEGFTADENNANKSLTGFLQKNIKDFNDKAATKVKYLTEEAKDVMKHRFIANQTQHIINIANYGTDLFMGQKYNIAYSFLFATKQKSDNTGDNGKSVTQLRINSKGDANALSIADGYQPSKTGFIVDVFDATAKEHSITLRSHEKDSATTDDANYKNPSAWLNLSKNIAELSAAAGANQKQMIKATNDKILLGITKTNNAGEVDVKNGAVITTDNLTIKVGTHQIIIDNNGITLTPDGAITLDKIKVKEDKISDLTELEGSTLKIGAQGVIKIG